MAVEMGKVMAKLNEKFKGKSITENFKKNLATKWAAKIETDEDIGGFIDDREDVILEASIEADRRATQAAKKAKEEAAKAISGEDNPEKKDEPEKFPEGTPEYMKAFMKQFETLAQKVDSIERGKQAETLESKFRKDDRLKGIPEFILKMGIPKSEEEYEAKVTEIAKEYGEFATQHKLSAFGSDQPAGGAKQPVGANKEPDAKELDAIMAKLN